MTGKDRLAGVVLLLALLVVYLPALRSGYIWDDDSYVTGNELLRSAEGLRRVWFEPGATPQYYPLVFTGFWVEYHLWGLAPFGYHLVNVLLHGLSALLVWLILRRLQVPGAWLAAAIFALHPVHVESVAWITERKNVLSGFFYLGALLAWLRFEPLEPGQDSPAKRWRWYGLSLALFLMALLSKTVTASLPAALVLILWWKHRASRRALACLVPFFVLGIALGLHTAWLERSHVGAEGGEWVLSWLERILIAGRALWFYLGKIVFPIDLTFIYPRWTIRTDSAVQFLLPLAAAGSVASLWLARSRIGRGPLVAALFFAGTLVPALGFFNTYPMRFSFVADHFQYLASLGVIVALAAVAAHLAGKWRLPVAWQRGLAAGVLVILGVATWVQAGTYKDARTLWMSTLEKNPDAWLAHGNLGVILYKEGDLAGALRHYSRAVELNPDYTQAHHNMGMILGMQGDLPGAEAHLSEAARLEPGGANIHHELGLALAGQGKLAEAEKHFMTAALLRPGYADAHLNLGVTLARQGRGPEAVPHFTEAIRLDPSSIGARYNLGRVLVQMNEQDKAAAQFRVVLEMATERGNLDLAANVREWLRGYEAGSGESAP